MAIRSLDLVVLRHGEAESYAGSDSQRALTERGRSQAQHQAQLLSEQGFIPEQIIHSPYLRTRQTADICHKTFPDALLKTHSGLLHSADVTGIPFMLDQQASVLMVSHMPLVARIVHLFCPGVDIYGFNVAGFVRMTVDLRDYSAVITQDATQGV